MGMQQSVLTSGWMMEVPAPFITPHSEVTMILSGYWSRARDTPETIFFILSTSLRHQSTVVTGFIVTTLYTTSPGQKKMRSQIMLIIRMLVSFLKAEANGKPRRMLVSIDPAMQDMITDINDEIGELLI